MGGKKPSGATLQIQRSNGSIATRKRPRSVTKDSKATKMQVIEDAKLEQRRDVNAKNGHYNHLTSIPGLGGSGLGKESSGTFAGILMEKKPSGATLQIRRSAPRSASRKGAKKRK